MNDFIYILIASVGMTLIVTEGVIFGNLREYLINKSENSKLFEWLADLFTCGQCFGLYAGMLLQLAYVFTTGTSFVETSKALSVVIMGLATSGACTVVRKLSER